MIDVYFKRPYKVLSIDEINRLKLYQAENRLDLHTGANKTATKVNEISSIQLSNIKDTTRSYDSDFESSRKDKPDLIKYSKVEKNEELKDLKIRYINQLHTFLDKRLDILVQRNKILKK